MPWKESGPMEERLQLVRDALRNIFWQEYCLQATRGRKLPLR